MVKTEDYTDGLYLQFPSIMQAWGADAPWIHERPTLAAPTKSAIVGIIGRAMGIDRDDFEKQQWLWDQVTDVEVIHQPKAKRMTDDQIVSPQGYANCGLPTGKLPTADGKGKPTGQPFRKDYIVDTIKGPPIVKVTGPVEFLKTAAEYLKHPIYPYYFGRYCCIPAGSILYKGEACR